ncbi:VanZ family protein [Streptomyces indicus]|uniref:VanZ like family protein n=1 Tax=Streptomyces indicus TaxID=417292 RepID=A0A1G8UMK3_9ACTN|nr:VanZ family protein [Streptomyces indicus]SDJ54220.1 VanZ like family protein [Streptomyces indicus]
MAQTRARGVARKSGRRPARPSAAPTRRPVPWPVRALAMLLALAAMVAFGVVLARLTLQPSSASVPLTHTNLRPGESIRDYLAQPAFRDTVKQLGGNILLGVPFGVLLPVVAPGARGILRVFAVTAFVMLCVEVVQGAVITGRAFDIDDVLLNTTGALLGYLLVGRRLARRIHPPRRRRFRWYGRPDEAEAVREERSSRTARRSRPRKPTPAGTAPRTTESGRTGWRLWRRT